VESLAISPGTLASLVIALSFAAGLNVYATVCALGVMARMHWVVLPGELGALAHGWVIGVSGVLFAVEIFADKVPSFDVIWNALHTFVRIPAAALLAYAAGSHLSPEMHLLVTCVGAAVAVIAHGSKTAARIAVTPSPEPVSNIALSAAEDGLALGLTWVATHHPLVGGGVAAAMCVAGIAAVWWGWRVVRRGVGRMWRGESGSTLTR
jgi:hypothetical protein